MKQKQKAAAKNGKNSIQVSNSRDWMYKQGFSTFKVCVDSVEDENSGAILKG